MIMNAPCIYIGNVTFHIAKYTYINIIFQKILFNITRNKNQFLPFKIFHLHLKKSQPFITLLRSHKIDLNNILALHSNSLRLQGQLLYIIAFKHKCKMNVHKHMYM